jgi:hypothetical protein
MRTTTHCRPCGSWGWAAASGQCGDPAGTAQHMTQHRTGHISICLIAGQGEDSQELYDPHGTLAEQGVLHNIADWCPGCETNHPVATHTVRILTLSTTTALLCSVCARTIQSNTSAQLPAQAQSQTADRCTKPNPPGHEQGCLQSL